jgi:hypothetical protein
VSCRTAVNQAHVEPPTGYTWSERARFFAWNASGGTRRITIDATRCNGCGLPKGEHGPELACPEPLVDEIPF